MVFAWPSIEIIWLILWYCIIICWYSAICSAADGARPCLADLAGLPGGASDFAHPARYFVRSASDRLAHCTRTAAHTCGICATCRRCASVIAVQWPASV